MLAQAFSKLGLFFSLLLFSTHTLFAQEIPPSASSIHFFVAQKGVLDLRNYNFAKDGVLPLEGEWEFYWKEFKTAQEIKNMPMEQRKYWGISSNWGSKQKYNAQETTPQGYATYSLKVLLPPNSAGKPFSLRLNQVLTAYKFYVDDTLLTETGKAGKTRETSVPEYSSEVKSFFPTHDEVRLTVHVSNFFYPRAGLRSFTFKIGSPQAVIRQKIIALSYDLVLLGIFGIMFLHHFALFFLSPKEKTTYLLFSIALLLFFIRVLTRGEMFIASLFPWVSFVWKVRLEYLSFYITAPILYSFLYLTIQKGFSRLLIIIFSAVGAAFSLVVLFTQPIFFSQTLGYYQLFFIFFSLTGLYGIGSAIYYRQPAAWFFVIGGVLGIAASINDILYSRKLSPIGEFAPIGFAFFVLAQAYSLSFLFAQSFKKLEDLIQYLERSVLSASRFVPKTSLLFLGKDSITDISLGESRNQQSFILFCDIRDFTARCENMSSKETFSFLNSYFKEISPVIRNHNGFIDKYLGDGILAFFDSRTESALAAGLEIQKKIIKFNRDQKEEVTLPMRAGVGIHHGEFLFGLVGEPQRYNTVAISLDVQLASYLESLTKIFSIPVIVSENAMKQYQGRFNFRMIGFVETESEPQNKFIFIYELLEKNISETFEQKMASAVLLQEGIQNILHERYKKALACFKEVNSLNRQDSVALYYIQALEKNEFERLHLKSYIL